MWTSVQEENVKRIFSLLTSCLLAVGLRQGVID